MSIYEEKIRRLNILANDKPPHQRPYDVKLN